MSGTGLDATSGVKKRLLNSILPFIAQLPQTRLICSRYEGLPVEVWQVIEGTKFVSFFDTGEGMIKGDAGMKI